MLIDFVPFVKSQTDFHLRKARELASSPKRAEKHREVASQFAALADAMEKAITATPPTPTLTGKPLQLALSLEEVQGLPDELLQELSISDGDKVDYMILKIIEEMGGIASLDRILVGIYRKTGEIQKRTTLTSRIYRMSGKGLLYSVPGRKGAYSLRELTDMEADTILP